MGPLLSLGWKALPTRPYPKWLAVKDARVRADLAPGRTIDDIHSFARSHIDYCRESGDDWQEPAETLALGTGDCEDICLLERALLLNLGYPDDDIELMIVRDLVTREDHALLFVGDHYLDNRIAAPLPATQFKDYRPITGHRAGASYLYGRVK